MLLSKQRNSNKPTKKEGDPISDQPEKRGRESGVLSMVRPAPFFFPLRVKVHESLREFSRAGDIAPTWDSRAFPGLGRQAPAKSKPDSMVVIF